MNEEFIKIENLSVIFEDGTVAADNVNITISEKEFLVLVGPSGCGKSTILRSVVGLQNINSGKIYIDNKDVILFHQEIDIAMIFQSYALYPHMTVRENLSIPLKLKKHLKMKSSLKLMKFRQCYLLIIYLIGILEHFQVAKNKELQWGGH